MSSFFPVVRYLEEDVKEIMTLDELHSIAEQRGKEKDDDTIKEKKKKKKKEREKLTTEESDDEMIQLDKKKRKQKEPNEIETNEERDAEHYENDKEEENMEVDEMDPLPMLTRQKPAKKSSHLPSTKYQMPSWVINYHHIESDIKENSQQLEQFHAILNPIVISNLTRMGITHFFPVQCKLIPHITHNVPCLLLPNEGMSGPCDVCVCAPTGCGKTLCYVVPIINSLMDLNTNHLRALVIVPSKDLARQVFDVFKALSKKTNVRIGVVCSLDSFDKEQENIVSPYGSEVDVLVATPGRLVAHIQETPLLSLRHLRYLVIDEADRIFEEEYHCWLDHVLKAFTAPSPPVNETANLIAQSSLPFLFPELCKSLMAADASRPMATTSDVVRPLRKLLFSATLSLDPEQLSKLQLHKPKLFTVATDITEQMGLSVLPMTLKEYHIQCISDYKPLTLLHIISSFGHCKILCFTHSCASAHRLTLLLQQYDIPVGEISSRMSSSVLARSGAIKKFANGKIKVLVCSDGMARGMDIDGVECVVNYDSPNHFRSYLHRVGRTARAGNEGVAYTLLTENEVDKFKRMIKGAGRDTVKCIEVSQDDLQPYIDTYTTALDTVAKLVNNK
jgi:ATP-dependent RNA helicase DDX51/DBP6